jgi:predicted dehydrogenase
MEKILNIAVIGCSGMRMRHVKGAASQKKARLYGVCDLIPERVENAAKQYNPVKTTTDWHDFVNDPEVDAAILVVPDQVHLEMADAFLRAGKHVLCEKPFTVSYEQASLLAAKAADKALVCGVVYNNRHLAAIMRAKQLIDGGALGRILSFSFHYRHDSDIDPARFVGWKQDATICGAGTLYDLGSHAIDLCRHLCGGFSSISGKSHIAFDTHMQKDGTLWQTNADEAFYMTATLQSGAVGQISVSKLAHGTEDGLSFEIYGTGGALRYSLAECDILYYMDASNPKLPLGGTSGFTAIPASGRYDAPGGKFPAVKAPQGWLRGHIHGMYLYLDAVASGQHFSPDFSDGACIQRIMAAAMKSDAEGGKEVQI